MKLKCSVLLILSLSAVQARLSWKDTKHRDICVEPAPTDDDDDVTFRIAGGFEAEPQRFGYQAGLFISVPGDDFFCGGCLISEYFVLTAAHCISDATVVLVKLGAFNVMRREKTQKMFKSRLFIVHERWKKQTIENDIAMIRLPQAVVFSDVIYPAKLPTGNVNYTNLEVVVSGWGKITDNNTSISGTLRCVFVTVLPNSDCSYNYPQRVLQTNLCTSGTMGRSACAGDSGGPICIVQKNITTIIGIVSFGPTNCQSGHPGVPTRVSKYVSWINAQMEKYQ